MTTGRQPAGLMPPHALYSDNLLRNKGQGQRGQPAGGGKWASGQGGGAEHRCSSWRSGRWLLPWCAEACFASEECRRDHACILYEDMPCIRGVAEGQHLCAQRKDEEGVFRQFNGHQAVKVVHQLWRVA